MRYTIKNRNYKSRLIELNDIVMWQHSDLKDMIGYRKEKENLFTWRNTTIKTPKHTSCAGLVRGAKSSHLPATYVLSICIFIVSICMIVNICIT